MAIKYRNNDIHGIINVYKEKDFTSHDVVAVIRKITGAKCGHTGTLDPQAEGVLPVCLGKATKLSDYLMAEEKEYSAEIILGVTTDTQDDTGRILEERPVNLDFNEIKTAVSSFTGGYFQTPPMYSAIKIDGKKLYELARQGKEVERKKRLINIFSIDITDYLPPDRIKISVVCSKGTYIRSLCADIGDKLGCGAHMGALLRTRTGNFSLKNSIKLADIKQMVAESKINDIMIPVEEVLKVYPKVVADKSADKYLYNGNKINVNNTDRPEISGNVLLYDSKDYLIGIYTAVKEKNEMFLKPVTILGMPDNLGEEHV